MKSTITSITHRYRAAIIAISVLFVLSACKGPSQQTPSIPGAPSAKPPSSGLPSPTSRPSSPPSSPSSSPPSSPSSSMPSDPSVAKSEPGQSQPNKTKTGQEKSRQDAGGELQTAGDDLAKVSEKLGKPSSDASDSASSEPMDVLLPETDKVIPSDELVFAESKSSTASVHSDPLEEEIIAAQEALAEASDALIHAGEAVASADTDEALLEAEDMIAKARIALIIASDEVQILSSTVSTTDRNDATNDATSDVFEDIEIALGGANVLLVIATQSVLEARTGLPDFETGVVVSPTTPNVTILDDVLDESLLIFEGDMEDARAVVINTTGPPSSQTGTSGRINEASQGIIEILSGEELGEIDPSNPANGDSDDTLDDPLIDNADLSEAQQVATGPASELNIPDAQGDDIVAQQLREAAMSESDPQLKAKLWEEYKRYKSGL